MPLFSSRIWPFILAAILMLLVSLVAVPRAAGAEGPAIMLPVPESPSTLQPQAVQQPSIRDGYWIVSTRRLPQGMDNYAGPPCFEYFYRGQNSPLKQSNRACFQSWLKPGTPTCFVVHGSFINWKLAKTDAERTFKWLKCACPGKPLQLVFVTWPSDESLMIVPAIGVTWMGQRAGFNGIYLSQMIDLIPRESPLTLIGHSHGTRVIASALHYRAGGVIQGHCRSWGPDTSRRIRTIFAAAAFEHHWFNPGERYDRALCATEMLINLRNRKDLALAAYPVIKPFATKTLARSGFTLSDRQRLGHLNCRTFEIDVTHLVGHRHIWPHWTKHKAIAHAISPYMCYSDYTPQIKNAKGDHGASKTEAVTPVNFRVRNSRGQRATLIQ